jgi:hypothetical protein
VVAERHSREAVAVVALRSREPAVVAERHSREPVVAVVAVRLQFPAAVAAAHHSLAASERHSLAPEGRKLEMVIAEAGCRTVAALGLHPEAQRRVRRSETCRYIHTEAGLVVAREAGLVVARAVALERQSVPRLQRRKAFARAAECSA